MRTKNLFVLLGMALLAMTACTEDIEKNNKDIPSEGLVIQVSQESMVTGDETPSVTRATYSGLTTTFEDGDQIGVYAVDDKGVVQSSNVCFTKSGDAWTAGAVIPFNPSWTYYAYAPYVASPYTPDFTAEGIDNMFADFITDGSNKFHVANQSTKANFQASDYMHAQGILSNPATIRFVMKHRKALAVIVSDLVNNKFCYSTNTDKKTNVSLVSLTYNDNIPFDVDGQKYFLMKPNTTYTIGGISGLSADKGKYIPAIPIFTGTITSLKYSTGRANDTGWSAYNTTAPSWLTVTPEIETGEPTQFTVTVTNSTNTTVSKGSGSVRYDVPGDATLQAASPVSDVDLSMVDNAGTARASRTTANCYLVHAPGTYKIPLVYGNAIKNGATNESAYYTTQTSNTLQRLVNHNNTGITDPWIKTVVGSSPDGAELVWEDVKGMISSVGIDGDYLTFTVDNSNIAEGNAVVAAKLGSTIVWSWHIWVTPQTLSSTTSIATGSHTYQVTPVNVGQVNGIVKTGATVYAGDLCKVRAVAGGMTVEFQVQAADYITGGTNNYNPSPYYQWGRKDAMYPCTGAFNSAGTLVSTYSGTTLITDGSVTTPGTTIQHPDYWYYNSSNYGPYGTNSTYAGKYNYWDMNQTSTGNITTATVKTVYDPCPPGFCVPTGNLYYYMGNTGSSNSSYGTWQSTPPGRTWIYGGANNFFPASGYRSSSYGSLDDVGGYGYYWSASAGNSNGGRCLRFNSGYWSWRSNGRAYGYPVRAVAEE